MLSTREAVGPSCACPGFGGPALECDLTWGEGIRLSKGKLCQGRAGKKNKLLEASLPSYLYYLSPFLEPGWGNDHVAQKLHRPSVFPRGY